MRLGTEGLGHMRPREPAAAAGSTSSQQQEPKQEPKQQQQQQQRQYQQQQPAVPAEAKAVAIVVIAFVLQVWHRICRLAIAETWSRSLVLMLQTFLGGLHKAALRMNRFYLHHVVAFGAARH